MVTFNNFFNNTEAVFKGCKKPNRKPNFKSNSGSKYWYGSDKKGDFVIRNSNHWSVLKAIGSKETLRECKSIASCQWHLKDTRIVFEKVLLKRRHNKKRLKLKGHPHYYSTYTGKCYLSDFKKI